MQTKFETAESLFRTADQCLLAPYSLGSNELQHVFGEILRHEVDYADLYFQYCRSEGWSLEEGIVKSGSFNIDQGVGVRAVSGDKTAFAYSDDISLPSLESAARATRAIAHAGEFGKTSVIKRSGGHTLYMTHDPIASLRDQEERDFYVWIGVERKFNCSSIVDVELRNACSTPGATSPSPM